MPLTGGEVEGNTDRNSKMSKIAFIGLGKMGQPMGANLIKAGHTVTGFDLMESNRQQFAAAGAQVAATLAEAVRDADVVITMIPTGKHVREAYEGDDGIIRNVRKDALLIDSSTIDVETSRAVNAAATAAGIAMVDAPVSGAVPAAEKGTLVFMVGGTQEAFARAEPILLGMGTNVVHVGAAGSGHAMKICNNMMTGMTMVALSEVFALSQELGLDNQIVHDVITKGSGNCWSLQAYCPVPGPVPASPANRDYEPGFSTMLMHKDMALSQGVAKDVALSTPIAAYATAMYNSLLEAGQGGKDFSVVIKTVRERARQKGGSVNG